MTTPIAKLFESTRLKNYRIDGLAITDPSQLDALSDLQHDVIVHREAVKDAYLAAEIMGGNSRNGLSE